MKKTVLGLAFLGLLACSIFASCNNGGGEYYEGMRVYPTTAGSSDSMVGFNTEGRFYFKFKYTILHDSVSIHQPDTVDFTIRPQQ